MPLKPGLTVEQVVKIVLSHMEGARAAYDSTPERDRTDEQKRWLDASTNTLYFVLSGMGFDHTEIVEMTKPTSASQQ